MKVLRLRSWNFQAPNLEAMTRFYQLTLGADLRAQQTLAGVKVNRLHAGETGLKRLARIHHGSKSALERRVLEIVDFVITISPRPEMGMAIDQSRKHGSM